MALGLFQWIGIGLVIALILIPIVRWFWKRFDMPSKWAIEVLQQKEKEAEEAQMWAGIESQVEAEETARREFEMKQKQKQESAGKPLDESQSADVWNKLGIDVPLLIDKSIEAPDWELVEKMSKLAEPTEGVPEAPDLDSISEEE